MEESIISDCLKKIKKECPWKSKLLKASIDEVTNKLAAQAEGVNDTRPAETNLEGKKMLRKSLLDGLDLQGLGLKRPPSNTNITTGATPEKEYGGGITHLVSGQADQYLEPFRLALATHLPRIMCLALDCLDKLIASGAVTGSGVMGGGSSDTPTIPETSETVGSSNALDQRPKTVMDGLVESVCMGASNSDESVQVLTTKVLVTAVVTPTCQVHDASLLMALRAIIQICLVAKTPLAHNSAEAGLRQILDFLYDTSSKEENEYLSLDQLSSFTKASVKGAFPGVGLPPSPGSTGTPSVYSSPNHTTANHRQSITPPGRPRRENSQDTMSSYSESGHQYEGESEEASAVFPWTDLGFFSGPNMYPEVYQVLAFQKPPFEEVAMGYRGIPYRDDGTPCRTDIPEDLIFPSLKHKDSFLVFRSLCKMSMAGPPERDHKPTDPLVVQSKELSLGLMLYILKKPDARDPSSFQSTDKFLYAVRQYLCVTMLRNCTSSSRSVVSLSLQLFQLLLTNHKDQLKGEIEVFITDVFLKILESQNSSFDHKQLVLEALRCVCQDVHTLVEIFLNYDCDLESINLFQRIALVLVRVARENPENFQGESRLSREGFLIQKSALQGLVEILNSLLNASKNATSDEATEIPESPLNRDGLSSSVRASESASSLDSCFAPNRRRNQSAHLHLPSFPGGSIDGGDDRQLDMSAVVVESFEQKKRTHAEIETGCVKFNLNQRAGVEYLESCGHIEMTGRSIANFLHEHSSRLDKTAVGDFLGREKEYMDGLCVRVLHEYVDLMDFSGMKFVAAMRNFLADFRLPGEAQKIDRMMEKFAEHFFIQNPDIFTTPDTAFILAFSVIMLNTDLHSPQIKEEKRMKKEDFIRRNRSYGEGQTIEDSFLSDIYDEILAKPFILKDDEEKKKRLNAASETSRSTAQAVRLKRAAYNKERENMVATGEALFKKKKNSQLCFLSIEEVSISGYMGPMFEVVWGPLVAVFSEVLNWCTSERIDVVVECLRGLEYGVRISGLLDFYVARDQFLNSIVKFSSLDKVQAMNEKNIECIQTLLRIAAADGNILAESWVTILRCVSQLARLQLISHGLQDDIFFADSDASNKRSLSKKGKSRVAERVEEFFGGSVAPARLSRQVEKTNAKQITNQISSAQIDNIFSRSERLDAEAIQHFIQQLCQVSREEIKDFVHSKGFRTRDEISDMSQPRVFSLQKLVEVTYINMESRQRVVWANIWVILSHHFADIGAMDNMAIAMYSVDSLRQLSLTFLAKDELQHFSFQRLFLTPYRLIMQQNKAAEVRELVLRCIENLISVRSRSIKSGWSIIFEVFTVASLDPESEITSLAFGILDKLISEEIDLLVQDFQNMLGCLYSFASVEIEQVAVHSVKHIEVCARCLMDKGSTEIFSGMNAHMKESMGGTFAIKFASSFKKSDKNAWYLEPPVPFDYQGLQLWWLVLKSLSLLIGSDRLTVRSAALDSLTYILRELGNTNELGSSGWETTFAHILFPAADALKADLSPSLISEFQGQDFSPPADPLSWILSTSQQVFSLWVMMFMENLPRTAKILPSLLTQLEKHCKQEHEALARFALSALRDLVLGLSDSLAATHNNRLVTMLSGLVEAWLPPVVPLPRNTSPIAEQLFGRVASESGSGKVAIHHEVVLGAKVQTVYGRGEVVKLEKPKVLVALDWGATLYTFKPLPGSQPTCFQEIEPPDRPPPSESSRLVLHTVMAIPTIQLVGEFLQLRAESTIKESGIARLLDALAKGQTAAASYACNYKARFDLRKTGLLLNKLSPDTLPSLALQEVESSFAILSVLFCMYTEDDSQNQTTPIFSVFRRESVSNTGRPTGTRFYQKSSFVERRLVAFMVLVLQRFIELERSILEWTTTPDSELDKRKVKWLQVATSESEISWCKQTELEESKQLNDLVVMILEGFKSFKKEQIIKHRATLFPYFCELILCRSHDIRKMLRNIFGDFFTESCWV